MSVLQKVAALEHRLNPVLVKEVRQALRSKRFRGGFGFTVLAGLVVAIVIVLGNTRGGNIEPFGGEFFLGVFGCLSGAVLAFVPLIAFNSMGAEFDENTYDMLVISRLRPRQIILGKLLAAGVLALVYFSAFGFFVVFAFLFGGIDPAVVFFSLPVLAVLSLTASSLALCLSSLSQKRVVRVSLTIGLAAMCVWAIMGTIMLVAMLTEEGLDFTDPDFKAVVSMAAVAALAVNGMSLAIGSTRLAHPEENRSTVLRVATFVVVLLLLGWGVWMWNVLGISPPFLAAAMMACAVAGMGATFFASERETLGRRVTSTLPRAAGLRLFALPWLPGGGRGFLWLVLTQGLILVAVLVATRDRPSFFGLASNASPFEMVATVACYVMIYTSFFPALLPAWTERPRRILLNRAFVFTSFAFGMVAPNIAGFLLGNGDWQRGNHLGNPFWVINEVSNGDGVPGALLVVTGLVIALQVRRVLVALMEVVRAPRKS